MQILCWGRWLSLKFVLFRAEPTCEKYKNIATKCCCLTHDDHNDATKPALRTRFYRGINKKPSATSFTPWKMLLIKPIASAISPFIPLFCLRLVCRSACQPILPSIYRTVFPSFLLLSICLLLAELICLSV